MAVIEFGGLKELADAVDNYHTNINKLYGNFDEFKLAIDKVVRNIIVSFFLLYITPPLPYAYIPLDREPLSMQTPPLM